MSPKRGNRRQTTFFTDEDYVAYLELLSEWTRKYNVEIWAYCLMPNHGLSLFRELRKGCPALLVKLG